MASDDQLKAARQQPTWVDEPATAPQQRYIAILIEDRDVPADWLLRIKTYVETGALTKGKAGEVINALKKLPRDPEKDQRDKNKPTIADIPTGRYAVQTGPDPEDISFYRVKENRDKTSKYILQIAGPNEHWLRGEAASQAIKKIHRAGVGNSAVLYGKKVGKCSQCNTRITNRLSRELGIGPVCGGRVYDDWEKRVNKARTALIELGLDPRENVSA